MFEDNLIKKLNDITRPLEGGFDLDELISFIGDTPYIFLGEASHGTKEYYFWRSEISKKLILEKGFSFIAVEGDWPDCYELNRYINFVDGSAKSADEALQVFKRWPTWMWANEEIIDLLEWLRDFNKSKKKDERVGFYGLDVYSLWESLDSIIKYLEEKDPKNLWMAYRAYRCFEPFGRDAQAYAFSTAFVTGKCEEEVVRLLSNIRTKASGYIDDKEAYFNAEQNALVLKNAEHYYRTMIGGTRESWNVRDSHMTETFERLVRFYGEKSKGIVWAHNTHIGDARATDMANFGMVNIGQLIRERYSPESAKLIGFGSYKGEVIAGRAWGAPMEIMQVPPAIRDSWEYILHRVKPANKMLIFNDDNRKDNQLFQIRGHRAIGVVYDPEYEFGNYVPTILPERYDALIFIDQTSALQPLSSEVEFGKIAETFPTGY